MSVSTPPKISIVTPSFNQGKYIEKTILSVLEQGYPNLEYIIIDGGSTDESVEIIKKYADRLTYWISEPDRGQSHAINKGFERATGEIFGWLNSDDWYHPGALQAVADAFVANPGAGAVVGAGEMVFSETGRTLLVETFPVTMQSLFGAVDRFFLQPSCFFRKEAWLSAGPLDESLNLAMDLDLWFRLVKEQKFALVERNLSGSLVHDSAKTTDLASHSLVDACLVIMRHGGAREGRDRLVQFVQELLDIRKSLDALRREIYEGKLLLNETEKTLMEREAAHAKALQQVEVLKIFASENLAYANSIKASLSWRITRPLRTLHKWLFGRPAQT